MTILDIHRWLTDKAGHPLNSDEGVLFGDPNRELRGVSVCWVASPANIRAAADAGHDAILHHEALLFPVPFDNKQDLNKLHWPTNRQRFEALVRGNLLASRLHGTLDQLWIYDAFAQQLGLTRVAAERPYFSNKVFQIEPTPVEQVIERVKAATGLPALRVALTQPGRIVRKIGLPWGGLGLFVNVGYMQDLIAMAPDLDLMIAGETDNYAMRFCTELGIDMIETSHEVSENAGLKRFADALHEQFPSLNVKFLEDACIWHTA